MQLSLRVSGGESIKRRNADYSLAILESLSRLQRHVRHVSLFIEDVNGPRGGIDKQCRCVVHLKGRSPIVIQDEDENLGNLVQRVANRASYALRQRVDRLKKKKRSRLTHDALVDFETNDDAAGTFLEPL